MKSRNQTKKQTRRLKRRLEIDWRLIKEIENPEKDVDKKEFIKYFSHETIILVNKLLNQNTEDLRKVLDKIKQ